ncbi:hypothetical protein D3C78_1339610 [compost metagenome]
MQRSNHGTAEHHKGHCRQDQGQRKRANHKHQTQLRALVRFRGQQVRAIGADLNRFQQHVVIRVVQWTSGLILMVNNGFKHAVFGIFQHRLKPGDVGVKARFQVVIQCFVCGSTNRTIHIHGEARLRLLDTRLSFGDVLFHRIHFSNTACRTRMNHVDSGSA